jgi:CO dehydrogenase/acetyl-CoA synthase gamma subunit (corrinoid Fe-S protein)
MIVTDTRKHAKGRIDVNTYEPTPYDEKKDGPDLVEIHVTETFSGDIEGDGVVRFLQAVREDGSASFVGIERVSGQIRERKGSFLLQDAGTLVDNVVTGEWFVIPGSGTEELEGLRGEGGFTAQVGEHASITLDYWFEGPASAGR